MLLGQVALGVPSPDNAGSAFGSALFPWLIAFCSRKRWRWGLVIGAHLGAWLVLLGTVAGRVADGV